jgi:hypothetical protein
MESYLDNLDPLGLIYSKDSWRRKMQGYCATEWEIFKTKRPAATTRNFLNCYPFPARSCGA